MNLKTYNLTEDSGVTAQESADMAPEWFTDDVVRWIDVTASDTTEVEHLLEPLDLHDAIRKAAASTEPRPEVIAFEDLLFVRLPYLGRDGEHHSLRLVCGPTAIVSARTATLTEIDLLANTLETGARKVQPSVSDLLIEIFEAVLREARPAALELRDEIHNLSDTLESDTGDITVGDLLALKGRSSGLVGLIEDQLISIGQLTAVRSSLSLSEIKDDLRTLVTFLEQIRPIVLRLDDQARELRQAHAGMLQESTNRRLNMLAILSAIYMPATLIAAIYGMNFTDIPITEIPHGYFYVIVLMAVLVVGQLVFFWRRGWFK